MSVNAYLGARPIARALDAGRRHRGHGALRRLGRHARAARSTSSAGRTTTTTASPPAASPATSSSAARRHGRHLHGLGGRSRAGTTWAIPIAECAPDGTLRRSPSRPGTGGLVTPRDGRRADALRDRRSRPRTCCPTWSATGATSRSGADRRPTACACQRRARPRPAATVQGERDLRRRLPADRHRDDRRPRAARKAEARRPRRCWRAPAPARARPGSAASPRPRSRCSAARRTYGPHARAARAPARWC